MPEVAVLFPHQLFEEHELLHPELKIYLIEEHLFFKEINFHKQKLAFHRASMQCYKDEQTKKGLNIQYVESGSNLSDIREFISYLASKDTNKLHFINPTDNWLEKRIHTTAEKHNIELVEYENPLFLNTREELSHFFKKDKKSFFQTTFYKQERKKRKLLIDEDENPEGGKWTFDTDNRKKYPKSKTPPAINFPDTNEHWKEAVSFVEKHYSKNFGELTNTPYYPFSQKEANSWFEQFLEQRFHEFGDFEDAIVKEELILNHSVLTPMLNVGLLEPNKVINKAIEYAKTNNVPLNSLEGFIRQIIGWREFIRGMYEVKGSFSRTENFWKFKNKIPASFYNGTTGIPPIDQTIKKVLKTGYCHHIERLMVLGNFMLLCEFDPDEVYRWFMELFIDSYDWVMVPNVYGMSQFADGGTFATKPYISGSNYLMKMSNYSKGDWQKTWDGLFWNFMDKHRNFFLSNPRLGMLVHTFDKMENKKKEAHIIHAKQFLEKINIERH